ncbi:MAG: 2TM domain-containing protein [candidate division Zixibacteria bacterium]|nr:2TM domain-containing protein [candidate division Zixibacteria bacterium]
MENQEAYQRAKERVEAKIGFYTHLSAYIVISIFLIIINYSTSSQYLWFKWPLIGWGIGVLFHGLGVFVFSGGSAIAERMIEKEMKKEASKKE